MKLASGACHACGVGYGKALTSQSTMRTTKMTAKNIKISFPRETTVVRAYQDAGTRTNPTAARPWPNSHAATSRNTREAARPTGAPTSRHSAPSQCPERQRSPAAHPAVRLLELFRELLLPALRHNPGTACRRSQEGRLRRRRMGTTRRSLHARESGQLRL